MHPKLCSFRPFLEGLFEKRVGDERAEFHQPPIAFFTHPTRIAHVIRVGYTA